MTTDEPFYPPSIQLAPRPLRFPFYLPKLVTNNLEIMPAQVLEQSVVISPGPPRAAWITGANAVRAVLVEQAGECPKGRVQNEVFRPLAGNAMTGAEGREWRWQRGAAAPLFRPEEVMRYGEVMREAADAMVATWRAAGSNEPRSIHEDMKRVAFAVMAKTLLAGSAADVLHAIEQGHTAYWRGANWWLLYTIFGLPHWLPRPHGRVMRAHEARVRRAVAHLVQARLRDGTVVNDLIGRLGASADPETGRHMDDALLVDNIVAFLMAGYDTTALTLTWTLYLLSHSPRWEAKILEEVGRVAGDGSIGAAHVDALVAVQQVVNEALRLYPPAPVMFRDFNRDIEVDGTVIPAGTIGVLPMYAIHRHRSSWVDPDRFDPGRFAPEQASRISRYQFLPFGGGARICIAAAFVMMELTIMVATFVRAARFTYAGAAPPRPVARMFLTPRDGLVMRVSRRSPAG